MVGLIATWALFGLKLQRSFAPMIVLLLVFMTGGVLAITQSQNYAQAGMSIAVTGFLAITSIFYAAIVAQDTSRLHVIRNAYISSALIVALLGILGYFHAFPGAEIFTLYDRAKGTFQDPNVFGPFLVLPAIFLLRDMLTRPLSKIFWPSALALFLAIALLLSFSRAAWGLLVFASVSIYLLVYINDQRPKSRLKLLALAGAAVVAVAVLLAIALSIDSVGSMFEQRAKLVQSYDGARLGRFARYSLGFGMIMDRPLGLGPLEFRNYFPEDEHNSYLKAFTTYGWIGAIGYYALVVWTIAKLFPLIFQPRPWQPYAQCVFVVLVGHQLVAIIIDTDHWRHLFMLYGLAWGMIASEASYKRRVTATNKRRPKLS